jgi:tellurite methyltransferase
MSESYESAHEFWDRTWADPKGREPWDIPDKAVLERARKVIEGWTETRTPRFLDIGCGAGRHALAMARMGFEVSACDASRASVALVSERLRAAGAEARVKASLMTSLPWPDGEFDYVVAWNVLYHGSRVELEKAASEARRLLSPGGWFQGTLLSTRNVHFGKGRPIDDRTWLGEGGSDKAHPHCYSDRDDAAGLFRGLRIDALEEFEQSSYEGAWHWLFLARKE